MDEELLTFVVPVTKDEVLARNVMSSQVYRSGKHQFIFQRGYTNVAKAYNDAVQLAQHDVLVFCHQDVYFPVAWESQFWASLRAVNALDANWGVLGAAGVTLQRGWGQRWRTRFIGDFSTNVAGGAHVIDYRYPRAFPEPVHTLDEFVLIVKRDNAHFDEAIPNNHFYGADLCLSLAQRGMRSYAISAYMHHDSASKWVFADFYESAAYMFEKYKKQLPIATTCVIIEMREGAPRFRNDFLGMLALTLRSALRYPKRATRSRRPV
ncbi:MAG: glycosyltransferase [Pseudomonadota bacterium]|jgi:hypothetical protein